MRAARRLHREMHVTHASLNRGAHGVLAASSDLLGWDMSGSLQG